MPVVIGVQVGQPKKVGDLMRRDLPPSVRCNNLLERVGVDTTATHDSTRPDRAAQAMGEVPAPRESAQPA